ncbi:translation initiation factor [bacterium]|nr:translation initiation factor [bacterium]
MSLAKNSRPIYSTGPRPVDSDEIREDQTIPSGPQEIVLRMERSGRGGKTVTVVEMRNFPDDDTREMAKELKRKLGTGGAVKNNTIEIQGEQRERIRAFFIKKRIKIRG